MRMRVPRRGTGIEKQLKKLKNQGTEYLRRGNLGDGHLVEFFTVEWSGAGN